MTPWSRVLRPSVVELGGYRPGVSGDEIKKRYGLREIVRLNWNESLFGPLPGVLEEAAAALELAWSYPEDSYEEFRRALADWAGADPSQIIPGHGIQALTIAVVSAFLDPGDAVVIPKPTYGLYAQVCRGAGATVHRVDSGPSLALDLEAIAACAASTRAKLVWVCDPNNPTGLRLDAADWAAFVQALPPDCVAIVDEAYGDYIGPVDRIDRLKDIAGGAPIVLLRTFSKIFGLAGLRLGYAIVDPSLAPHLNAVQEPFNVNRAALAAGLASLRRVDQIAERREQARVGREALVAPLGAAGFRCLSSDANFVLVELAADDQVVCDALAREGVLLRPGSELGLPGFARVTTGDPELMRDVGERLVEALARETLPTA